MKMTAANVINTFGDSVDGVAKAVDAAFDDVSDEYGGSAAGSLRILVCAAAFKKGGI